MADGLDCDGEGVPLLALASVVLLNHEWFPLHAYLVLIVHRGVL